MGSDLLRQLLYQAQAAQKGDDNEEGESGKQRTHQRDLSSELVIAAHYFSQSRTRYGRRRTKDHHNKGKFSAAESERHSSGNGDSWNHQQSQRADSQVETQIACSTLRVELAATAISASGVDIPAR